MRASEADTLVQHWRCADERPREDHDARIAAILVLAALPDGGHGAQLSPPPGLSGLIGELLNDPPGFDRSALPAVDGAIVGFFQRHLEAPGR